MPFAVDDPAHAGYILDFSDFIHDIFQMLIAFHFDTHIYDGGIVLCRSAIGGIDCRLRVGDGGHNINGEPVPVYRFHFDFGLEMTALFAFPAYLYQAVFIGVRI